MCKAKIEALLKIKLECRFSNELFQIIFDQLEWMDFYESYKEDGGFFSEFPKLGPKRHLYLPYYISYGMNRCARVHYLLCSDDATDMPYGGFVAMRTNEGHSSDPVPVVGFMTEDMDDEYNNYNSLYIDYLMCTSDDKYGTNVLLNKKRCDKVKQFVEKYTRIMKVHDSHKEDMNVLCNIIGLVWDNFGRNKNIESSYFYVSEYLYVNLEGAKAICKYVADGEEQESNILEVICNCDFPYERYNNKFHSTH